MAGGVGITPHMSLVAMLHELFSVVHDHPALKRGVHLVLPLQLALPLLGNNAESSES